MSKIELFSTVVSKVPASFKAESGEIGVYGQVLDFFVEDRLASVKIFDRAWRYLDMAVIPVDHLVVVNAISDITDEGERSVMSRSEANTERVCVGAA